MQDPLLPIEDWTDIKHQLHVAPEHVLQDPSISISIMIMSLTKFRLCRLVDRTHLNVSNGAEASMFEMFLEGLRDRTIIPFRWGYHRRQKLYQSTSLAMRNRQNQICASFSFSLPSFSTDPVSCASGLLVARLACTVVTAGASLLPAAAALNR